MINKRPILKNLRLDLMTDETWHTADGRKIPVRAMNTRQLLNTIAWVNRNANSIRAKELQSLVASRASKTRIEKLIMLDSFSMLLAVVPPYKAMRDRAARIVMARLDLGTSLAVPDGGTMAMLDPVAAPDGGTMDREW